MCALKLDVCRCDYRYGTWRRVDVSLWQIAKKGFTMSTVTGYDDLTNGQTKAIVSKMGGVDIALAFLRDEYQLTRIAKAVKQVLTSLGETIVTFAKKSDLEAFAFQTRDGLYVEEAVTKLLGKNVTGPTETSVTLGRHALSVDANDTQITAELQPGYTFKGEAGKELLKQVIASSISAQWGGTEGVLTNNGFANIFYFEREDGVRFTVDVRWRSVGREWRVYLWGFDGYAWRAGFVVFSLN